KNEQFDAKKLHLARNKSTKIDVQPSPSQIRANREPFYNSSHGGKNRCVKRHQGDKRLPLMPHRQGVVTQNVLHVIKFQVADRTIYVTSRTNS
ncbi:hypothetical protein ACSZM8_18575, partial [Aeromonas caviae]